MKIINKTLLLLFLSLFLFYGFTSSVEKDKNKINKSSSIQNVGDSYRLFINKIDMPMNSRGVLADVKIDGRDAGRIDGKNFLFSGGFFLSGYNENGIMWTNAVASASRTEDYLPGNFADDEDSKGLFVVKSGDPDFGESWQEWITAVKYGAYFYDGDGDGVYNPVDLNGNGVWDETEDKPDILGDETVWTVYSDKIESADRNFSNVEPQGIEIRQTAWAYATSGDLGNIMFLRYSILNTGAVSQVHDSVYLGIWADPDLGDYKDDLVGNDTTLNAGFVYNDGDDPDFGIDPPAFLIDFFQGPWEFTGNPEDVAYNTRGLLLGIDTIKGAKNLGMDSFVHYMQSHPTQGDPDDEIQARNYLRGRNQKGDIVDPCNWQFGAVFGGENCLDIDGRFMYQGDPVALKGWLNTTPTDQRQMSNTGPFKLIAGQPVDVVVALVAGRGNSALASVKDAKKIDRAAQFVFQNNFNFPAPPPMVEPIIKTEDNAIELIWNTKPQFDWNPVGNGFDMKFQGYEVYMYNKESTALREGGQENAKLIAKYDVQDEIKSVLYEDPVTNERRIIFEDGIQLDPEIYSTEDGRIRLRITLDPFTNSTLIKGKPYFFSITAFGLNMEEIVQFDAIGTYMIPNTAAVGIIQNVPTILKDENGNNGIVPGDNANTPYYSGIVAEHSSGSSDAMVSYSVYDKSMASSDIYEVGFFLDSLSTIYNLFYYVKNTGTGNLVADSMQAYDSDDINKIIDGVILDVDWVEPGINKTEFEGDIWFAEEDTTKPTGVFYVGNDVASPGRIAPVSTKTSKAINVTKMKRVELRFGETSKAFRYVRDPLRFIWAGKDNPDEGFVDVPFAAYVNDPSGEQRRLAVGFTESNFSGDTLAHPDGIWNPYGNIADTKEYIIIFDGTYSENLEDNLAYSGLGNNRPADVQNGYQLRATVPGATDSLIQVAKSAWFDAMYVVGLEALSPSDNFSPTGTLIIEPTKILTPADKYTYQIKLDKDASEEAAQFEKVNVYPNPLFAYNPGVSYTGGRADEPYVTFGNLPKEVEIKIYTLSGVLVRTLKKNNNSSILQWDLENQDRLRVASGMYLAIVSNPDLGDKVLKFGIIMPQKQIQYY